MLLLSTSAIMVQDVCNDLSGGFFMDTPIRILYKPKAHLQRAPKRKRMKKDEISMKIVNPMLTGLKIIRAVCDGEKDPKELASLRHFNCRKSEEEIAKALIYRRNFTNTFKMYKTSE